MGGGSGKFEVSSGGGIQPVWRNDEKEMYFLGPDGKLMAVSVKAGAASFEAGELSSDFEKNADQCLTTLTVAIGPRKRLFRIASGCTSSG